MLTELHVNGLELSYPPVLDLPELPASNLSPGRPQFEHLVQSSISSTAASEHWAGLRKKRQGSTLKIVVLGTSSSNGCGSSESFHDVRCSHHGALLKLCDHRLSWERHLQDVLRDRKLLVRMRVHARNAAMSIFFARCTSRYVSASTDIVILELAQTSHPAQLGDDLPTLVAAIRRHAPAAAIVLVTWGKQSFLFPDKAEEKGAILSLERSAQSLDVDVLRMDLVAFELMRQPELASQQISCRKLIARANNVTQLGMTAPSWGSRQVRFLPVVVKKILGLEWLYAQRGLDMVHPSPEGHLLIGRTIAQYVFDRLGLSNHSVSHHVHERVANSSWWWQQKEDGTPRPAARPPDAMWEHCLGADELPVVSGSPTPWRLVDEGGAKGVKKLGWLSQNLDDWMLIGPVGAELQSDERRKIASGAVTRRRGWKPKIKIEVGFLLGPHDDFGALHFECKNCTCKREVMPIRWRRLHARTRTDACA